MQVSAIISEYNPLHKGHMYHIEKTKEITNADAIICIMSGNYVQRGTPAIIDKWHRTKNALNCGIDLVIELPVLYSLSSAEFFAFGAVSLINSLGIVNSLSFGSELGSMDLLMSISKILVEEPKKYKEALKFYLDMGLPYPTARSKALTGYILNSNLYEHKDIESVLNTSNNILAIEYCKSLIKLKSNVSPYTIKREGGSYNSTELSSTFSSATSIRRYIKDKGLLSELEHHLPTFTYTLLNELSNSRYNFVFEDFMLPYIKYKYFNDKASLLNLPDVKEGLHNKIFKALDTAINFSEAVEIIKSKRYTYTRISRILSQFYVGFDKFDTADLRKKPCPYVRVLGFNENGKSLLKHIKANSDIPLYSKMPKQLNEVLELDLLATKSYSLLNKNIAQNSDYLFSPIIL